MKLKFNIEYFVFKDGGTYISYCPSLDLSTSGSTIREAKRNFKEAFELYVETEVELGTLLPDLESHGWKKKKDGIELPSFYKLMKKPEMKKLMAGGISYEKVVTPASVPALA